MTQSTAVNASSNQAIELDAVIIGAGFSGMYQLLSLRDKLGMKAKVLEAGAGVGAPGTGIATRVHAATRKAIPTCFTFPRRW